MRHFYHRTLRVEPGGSRKRDAWIAGTFAEVTEFLRADLETGQGAYHAICYGETMEIECWQDRTLVASFDLHPCVEFTIEGLDEPIWFDDGAAFGYDFDAEEDTGMPEQQRHGPSRARRSRVHTVSACVGPSVRVRISSARLSSARASATSPASARSSASESTTVATPK